MYYVGGPFVVPSPNPTNQHPTTPADSNLEMTWHTFAGDLDEILLLALIYRCHKDGLPTDPETLKQQFRLHLHRGIGYLVAECEVKKLTHFIRLLYRENKNTD